jgi:hypothetical protein
MGSLSLELGGAITCAYDDLSSALLSTCGRKCEGTEVVEADIEWVRSGWRGGWEGDGIS